MMKIQESSNENVFGERPNKKNNLIILRTYLVETIYTIYKLCGWVYNLNELFFLLMWTVFWGY